MSLPSLLCNVTCHCVRTAENLECVQSETIGLILAVDALYSKIGCQSGKILKWCNGVLWETFVKFIGFVSRFLQTLIRDIYRLTLAT